jgi:CheY-like chemotaxis protein
MTAKPPQIMLLCSGAADAELVSVALRSEFPALLACLDPSAAVEDFERCLPDVLLLACRRLEDSQQRTTALYAQSEIARAHPHRTLVLCHADQTDQTYELCKRGDFDDYIKFWPHTFDVWQLPMSVLHALRQLRAAKVLTMAAGELMNHADRSAAAELLLAPGGSDAAGAVQVIQRKMWALLQPGDSAAAASWPVPSLKRAVDQVETLTAHSVEMRKQTETHLVFMRTMRESKLARAPPPVTVLIVEDDEFQQKMLTRLLQQEQMLVESALSVQAATAAIGRHVPALILLDYELPDGDGISWLLEIRNNPLWAGVPVIMLTGNSDKQIVVTSMQAGVKDFIVKPVDPIKLRDKVRRFARAAA